YRDIDVLLVPSNIPDPAPLVVMEAMSAGIVVAGYPAGGIPSMVENGRTGILADTPDAIARELVRLTTSPEAFAAMRTQAFETARTEFGTATFYRRLLDTYEAVLRTAIGRRTPAATPTGVGMPEAS